VKRPQSITVFTRRNPAETAAALRKVIEMARAEGVEVRIPEDEVEKHGLEPGDGTVHGADPAGPTDVAVALGGDGTILASLRLYAGRGVPTFGFNFGAIGFLATLEHEDLEEGMRRALAGDFEVLALPSMTAETPSGDQVAVNDISFHREQDGRVAYLAYSVEGEGLGEVRCDGLVVSTPAGSTGYNLANGGPVLAWGVEGYVVSFIAPHTLTARALVVAPDDVLEVENRSDEDRVEMDTDGRGACTMEPGHRIRVRFEEGKTLLAQVPGASFYHRLRDKFGRLSY
jgi:NAD+ kinase